MSTENIRNMWQAGTVKTLHCPKCGKSVTYKQWNICYPTDKCAKSQEMQQEEKQ